MRKPQQPPSFSSLLADAATLHLAVLYLKRDAPALPDAYLHWDDMRRRKPPEGLNHEAWWLALKLARKTNFQEVELEDLTQRHFQLSLPPGVVARLHALDAAVGRGPGMAQPSHGQQANPYLVPSLLEEAITSSQLEGAVTTRQVAKEMLLTGRRPRDESERMILNNYRTMQAIVELRGQPLTADAVFQIHRLVTEGTLKNPDAAGRFRTEAEAIELGDHYGETFHQPPPAHELPERLRAMVSFANEEDPQQFLHPVVRAILLHFWLAYDHPFVDGNGRTARALFYWAMLRHGYSLFEYISISSILRKGPVQYARSFLLTETDENDLTYFLLAQLEVIGRALEELQQYAGRKALQTAAQVDRLQALEGLNLRQEALVQQALETPAARFTVQGHQNITGVAYQTARTDLLGLVELGLFSQSKRGRQMVFMAAAGLEGRLG